MNAAPLSSGDFQTDNIIPDAFPLDARMRVSLKIPASTDPLASNYKLICINEFSEKLCFFHMKHKKVNQF
jgi:hypothetical protein